MRSLGVRVHQAGEPEAPQHQPVVVDVGGLRQAGGAGGVDVERAILDGQRRALGRRRAARTSWRSIALIDARKFATVFAVRPRSSARAQQAAAARSRTARRSSAATMTCFGATMSMQWASDAPTRLVLSSATTPPAAGDAEPDRHIFGPVRHHQADRLALGAASARAPSARSGWRARRARGS